MVVAKRGTVKEEAGAGVGVEGVSQAPTFGT